MTKQFITRNKALLHEIIYQEGFALIKRGFTAVSNEDPIIDNVNVGKILLGEKRERLYHEHQSKKDQNKLSKNMR